MIYDNNQFLTTEGPEQEEGGGGVLVNPDRLHKSALFKWANIRWSAALWSIIPDSYPGRERGINHREKLFSQHTNTRLLSTSAPPPLVPPAPRQVCFVGFFPSARPVKTQNAAFCRNHCKWLCASISVIGFRSSLEWGKNLEM